MIVPQHGLALPWANHKAAGPAVDRLFVVGVQIPVVESCAEGSMVRSLVSKDEAFGYLGFMVMG